MKSLISLVAGATMLTAGCATVPDDAPEELHSAKAAIDAADDAGADEIVPKTMDAAESKLDDAVVLFEESKDEEGEPVGKLEQSKKDAVTARSMADNAAALTADIKGWDGSDLAAWAALKNPAQPDEPAVAAAEAPELELTKPVAFFATDDSRLEQDLATALDELVMLMKTNDGLYVTLVGYADRRGTKELNDALSAKRAESVAAYLSSQGIAQERIKVESKGAAAATAEASDLARLQLDRRVDAAIGTVAH